MKELGSGGMATVYLARRHGAQKLCVIKQLHAHYANQEVVASRFLREAQLGALLSHPNIAQVLDAGREQGQLYLAMEYIAGQDLESLIHALFPKRVMLPFGFSASVAIQTLTGLDFAHNFRDSEGKHLHLVHRDLSPRNIMIGYDGKVRVIDFGLARATVDSYRTNPGVVLGTFRYMSPQQALGDHELDHRSDLFTMGVVLYEAFSGLPLITKTQQKEILEEVIHLDPPPISQRNKNLPNSLDPIFQKALAIHPDERFQTAAEFRDALLQAIPKLCATPQSYLAKFLEDYFPEHHQESLANLQALAEELSSNPPEKEAEGQYFAQTMAGPKPGKAQANSTMVVDRRKGRPRSAMDNTPLSGGKQGEASDRYELIEKLKEGGMGSVWLAQRRGDPELCVVKVLHPHLQKSDDIGEKVKRRFMREAELATRIDHPHIANIRYTDWSQDELYLDMEFIAGQDLRSVRETLGKLSPEAAATIFIQILDGLHYAHELRDVPESGQKVGAPLNLVHRDLTPQNIMLSYTGSPKIIDFGVARADTSEAITQGGTVVGNWAYMSPEQACASPVDRRSDIYTLGITIHELLTGKPVVAQDLTLREIMEAILSQDAPPLRQIDASLPASWETILLRATAKNSQDRYQSADEFKRAIQRAFPPNQLLESEELGALISEAFATHKSWTERWLDNAEVGAFGEDAGLSGTQTRFGPGPLAISLPGNEEAPAPLPPPPQVNPPVTASKRPNKYLWPIAGTAAVLTVGAVLLLNRPPPPETAPLVLGEASTQATTVEVSKVQPRIEEKTPPLALVAPKPLSKRRATKGKTKPVQKSSSKRPAKQPSSPAQPKNNVLLQKARSALLGDDRPLLQSSLEKAAQQSALNPAQKADMEKCLRIAAKARHNRGYARCLRKLSQFLENQ